MKKLIVLSTILINAFCANAQEQTTTTVQTTTQTYSSENNSDSDPMRFYIGGRVLGTATSLNYHQTENGTVKAKATLGYGIGGYFGYNFSNNMALQAEVLYMSLIQNLKVNNTDRTLKLRYVNIPLLLVFNTNVNRPVNLNVAFGPQIGIKAGADLEVDNGNNNTDTVTAVAQVKPTDVGIAYGAGLDFGLAPGIKLGLGFRGVLGLVDIADNSNNTTTNQYYILDRSKLKTYSGYAGLTIAF